MPNKDLGAGVQQTSKPASEAEVTRQKTPDKTAESLEELIRNRLMILAEYSITTPAVCV